MVIRMFFKADFDLQTEYTDSKFYGTVALPAQWLENDVFAFDEMFVCQINLSQLSAEQASCLPVKSGTLFFFLQRVKRGYKAIIRYFDGELTETVDFNDDLDEECDMCTEIPLCLTTDFNSAICSAFVENGNDVELLRVYDFEEQILPVCGEVAFVVTKDELSAMCFDNVRVIIDE